MEMHFVVFCRCQLVIAKQKERQKKMKRKLENVTRPL
ncbi:hypothetical protein T4A_12923 [Trichinella pseudospiralis]|uniref:Uncharacterized protein n=1 Tax=Trichinella pseudospiralis TaxID=6337 RepID=A0A0V1DMX5_TRIPS|nr:hypothetical protein T4A_12923 [Trichinella pseudospiralis]